MFNVSKRHHARALRSAAVLLSCLCHFSCIDQSEAQTVSYSGKVTGSADAGGTGLGGAIVRLTGTKTSAVAGTDGSFSISATFASVLPHKAPGSSGYALALGGFAGAKAYLADGREPDGNIWNAGNMYVTRILGATFDSGMPLGFGGTHSSGREAEAAAAPGDPAAEPAAKTAMANTSPAAVEAVAADIDTLTAFKVGYLTGTFPQSATTAANLVLALVKSPDTSTYQAEKKLCLDTINAYRASVGKPALAWSKTLETFADEGARYDAEFNQAHTHFGAFVINAQPADAENALPGWPLKYYKNVATIVAKGTEQMWGEGPGGGHYENIKGDHTVVGCGIYVTPQGNVWVIQDFK